jgi:hypothetical protein
MSDENESSNLQESLITTIGKANLAEAVADIGEVGIDQLLDEGVVRDIPFLGLLVRAARTFGVVRDWLFARKVVRFFKRLGEIPIEDRERFLAQHENPVDRQHLGETLMLLLDRHDDMEKPDPLARLFAGYMRGEYDLETFRRLAGALDRLPLSAIPELQAFYDEPEHYVSGQPVPRPGRYHSQFIASGLADIAFMRTGPTGGPGGYYAKNELGKLFLKVLTESPNSVVK